MKYFPVLIAIFICLTGYFTFATLLLKDSSESNVKSHPSYFKHVKSCPNSNTGPFGSLLRLRQDECSLTSTLVRQEISYLGLNQRPDASKGELFLKLESSGKTFSAKLHTPLYLSDASELNAFTISKTETPLYVMVTEANASRAKLSIFLKPKENYQERLLEEFNLSTSDQKLDTFLSIVKHDLKWGGKDLFLEDHCTENRSKASEKIYYINASTYNYIEVEVGDLLYWNDKTWTHFNKERSSSPYYLMECLAISPESIEIVLWAPFSSRVEKVFLTPAPSTKSQLERIQEGLRFLSIKNLKKLNMSYLNYPFTVSPGDWFLVKPHSLEKISSKQQLEDYINGNLNFPLLVIDDFKKKNHNYYIEGHIYNVTRTDKLKFEIPLKQKNSPKFAHIPTLHLRERPDHELHL